MSDLEKKSNCYKCIISKALIKDLDEISKYEANVICSYCKEHDYSYVQSRELLNDYITRTGKEHCYYCRNEPSKNKITCATCDLNPNYSMADNNNFFPTRDLCLEFLHYQYRMCLSLSDDEENEMKTSQSLQEYNEIVKPYLEKTQKETEMTQAITTVEKIKNTVKEDIVDGVWRAAAEQTLKTIREPLLTYIKSKCGDTPSKFVDSFIETQVGEAAFAITLGSALGGLSSTLPEMNSPKLVRLGDEIRKYGWYKMTMISSEIIMGPAREVLKNIVSSLPGE